jgi:hypothetical protein
MAGRGRLGDPRRWSTWGNRIGRAIGKSVAHDARGGKPTPEMEEVPEATPPRKASREVGRARTKTDTGGQVENTKAIGRTLVKELGKMAP